MRPGELTTLEQIQLMARAAAAQAMSAPSMLRLRLGRSPTRTPELRKRPLPDTKLCSEALDHARGTLPRGLEPQPALLDLGRRLRADRCDRVRPRRSLHCVRPSRCRTGRRRIGRARVFHLHQCRRRRRTRDPSGNFGEVGTANRRSDPSAHGSDRRPRRGR